MSVISECVGPLCPHEFVHKGKTYQVRHVDQEVKAAFEKRLFGKAKEAALLLKECMTADEYREHLKKLNDDYIAGEYALESSRAIAMLGRDHGGLLLISLLLGVPEMEALRLLAERKDDLAGVLALVVRESFPTPEEEGGADAASKSEVA